MKETPSKIFNKRILISSVISIILILVWFIVTNEFLVPRGLSYISIILVVIISLIIRFLFSGSFLLYLKDFSKASEKDVKEDYINIFKSTWLYLLMLFLGISALYVSLFDYTQDLPPKAFLIILGLALIISPIYGWFNRKRNINKTMNVKQTPNEFKASKNATVLGVILLFIVNILYSLFNLSWTQGFLLVIGGIIIAVFYYYYLKNKMFKKH